MILYHLAKCVINVRLFTLMQSQLEEDQTGFIHLDKFLPAATSALLEKK